MLFDGQLVGDGLLPRPFDREQYVPVILTRQGERLAMRELADGVREGMTPLFVVHPIDTDLDTGAPKRSVADHLGLLAKQLAKEWGKQPAFVDLRYVDTSSGIEGRHPLEWFVLECQKAGLLVAPAISGAHDAAYRAAAAAVSRGVGTSVALRLGPTEWPSVGSPLGNGHVLSLLADAGRPAAQVHLIIDVQQLNGPPDITAAALRPALRGLPHATEWASLSLVGTGMPDTTDHIPKGTGRHVPRLEWSLWRSLNEHDYRQPAYGDYCVQSPNPMSDFDPRYMQSSAQLRYTTTGSWYIARGRSVKATGTGQVHNLAQLIVKEPAIFSGATFSWGDRWLEACARHADGPGSQMIWRKVTTNHHLTFVVDQLATLHGS